jgi:hypothetical protein
MRSRSRRQKHWLEDQVLLVGHVRVVAVPGVAGAEDLLEPVVPGLPHDLAERRGAGEVGGVAVQVPAVGVTRVRVAGDAPEGAGDDHPPVAEGVAQRLQLPHDPQRVRPGLGGGDQPARPRAVALVHLAVGEVDRGAVVVLEGVDAVEGLRPGDAGGGEPVGGLEAAYGRLGRVAEDAVDDEVGVVTGITGHPDLELGHGSATAAVAEFAAPCVAAIGRGGSDGGQHGDAGCGDGEHQGGESACK